MKSISAINHYNATIVEEALKSPKKIGNMSKTALINCMPACRVQDNANQMSFALYPQKDNFFYQEGFCHVASHVWQVSCQDENRKYFLDIKHPLLCQTLNDFDRYFGNTSSCNTWPDEFIDEHSNPNSTLVDQMFEYGRKNLAYVQVMIKSPYITKIKRDVAMTFTTYVGNTGGLLGLCLGFSFISAIEIVFWLSCCCRDFKRSFELKSCWFCST